MNYNSRLFEIAYCGHHCKFCHFKDCFGCRSDNPGCSYATLFEDKLCPNVKCCKSKGIDGCYECVELKECTYGFYSRREEQVAKATALFIQKHGKENFHYTVENAINNGINYPHQFNELDSVRKMIDLLETFMRSQGDQVNEKGRQ